MRLMARWLIGECLSASASGTPDTGSAHTVKHQLSQDAWPSTVPNCSIWCQGRRAARAAGWWVVADRTRVLGRTHPDTLTSRQVLAYNVAEAPCSCPPPGRDHPHREPPLVARVRTRASAAGFLPMRPGRRAPSRSSETWRDCRRVGETAVVAGGEGLGAEGVGFEPTMRLPP